MGVRSSANWVSRTPTELLSRDVNRATITQSIADQGVHRLLSCACVLQEGAASLCSCIGNHIHRIRTIAGRDYTALEVAVGVRAHYD
jgi:hypothetical protein